MENINFYHFRLYQTKSFVIHHFLAWKSMPSIELPKSTEYGDHSDLKHKPDKTVKSCLNFPKSRQLDWQKSTFDKLFPRTFIFTQLHQSLSISPVPLNFIKNNMDDIATSCHGKRIRNTHRLKAANLKRSMELSCWTKSRWPPAKKNSTSTCQKTSCICYISSCRQQIICGFSKNISKYFVNQRSTD